MFSMFCAAVCVLHKQLHFILHKRICWWNTHKGENNLREVGRIKQISSKIGRSWKYVRWLSSVIVHIILEWKEWNYVNYFYKNLAQLEFFRWHENGSPSEWCRYALVQVPVNKNVEVAGFCNAIKPCCITHLYVLDFIYQNQYWAFNAKHAAMPWPTQRDIRMFEFQ